MDAEDIRKRFTHHPPTGPEQVAIYENLRAGGLELANQINASVRDGREKSLAITHLEQAVMWANAGIARAEA